MIIQTIFYDDDETITVENEDGEPFPEEGDVIYFQDTIDEGFRVGRILYDKYNVRYKLTINYYICNIYKKSN
jgi:hypothetical protein